MRAGKTLQAKMHNGGQCSRDQRSTLIHKRNKQTVHLLSVCIQVQLPPAQAAAVSSNRRAVSCVGVLVWQNVVRSRLLLRQPMGCGLSKEKGKVCSVNAARVGAA